MSVAFGYLLAVLTFLAISGTKSTSSPSRWLLIIEDPAHQEQEVEESEQEEEEGLDEVNNIAL
jgi:hypothetical protein